MPRTLGSVALSLGARLVSVCALSLTPELGPTVWTTLDVQGKTNIILTSSDLELTPDDRGDSTALYVPVFRGGLGDSLRQLGWAIFFAEQHNFTIVDLTSKMYHNHFAGFLDIPDNLKNNGRFHSIPVEPNPAGYVPSARCFIGVNKGLGSNNKAPSFWCPPMKPQEWARVLRKNVKPLLAQGVLIDKGAVSGELVIHMRSGDAMTTHSERAVLEVTLPPCAFYDKIIDEGGYSNIRIITQSDALNPCVREVGQRHPKLSINVQRGAITEDAAAIMNAPNLVLASSYLSIMLALMNERAKAVFYAMSPELYKRFPFGVVPCGAEGDPKAYALMALGIDDRRLTVRERQDWMMAYSKESVTVMSEC